MKKSFLLIILLFFISKVNALEFCTPSDEYLEYMAIPEEERSKYVEPIYCKEALNNRASELSNIFKLRIADPTYPERYSSVDEGYGTVVETQGSLGTCWDFSAMSVVETNARKENVGNYNFSEQHVLYSILSAGFSDTAGKKGKYLRSDFNGGKITYAASYFFNNYGQLYESEWPYDGVFKTITSSQYKKGRPIISVANYEIINMNSLGTCTSTEIDNIKDKIYNYGATQATMYMDTDLFRDSGNNYYISRISDSPYQAADHGVTIVGWDDTISKSNFNGASRDGAWIVKNSWGPNWSGDGYFYISYDDQFICKNNVSYSGVSSETYEYTYKAADLVGVPEFQFGNTFYLSTKFSKQASLPEELKRVTIPAGKNVSYTVYLSKSNTINNQNDWIEIANGRGENYSLLSSDIDSETIVSDDYTIIVKYKVDGNLRSSMLTTCSSQDDTSALEYKSGVNFYSTDGTRWYDMYSMSVNNGTKTCEPNIFAYTNELKNGVGISSISVSSSIIAYLSVGDPISSGLTVKVKDSRGSDVTYRFDVNINYATNRVILNSDGKTSGKFTLEVTYNGITSKKQFELVESVVSLDSKIKIKNKDIFITMGNNETFNFSRLISKLKFTNTNYSIYYATGGTASSSGTVTTNAKINTNNNIYRIIILGDVNGDGKITALDYIEIRKHIMGTKISNAGKLLASDMDGNSKITALDYIEIRKILMR